MYDYINIKYELVFLFFFSIFKVVLNDKEVQLLIFIVLRI